MELVLQRYSWVGSLVAAVLCAYLAARAVNTFAATAIAPKPSLNAVTASPKQPAILHTELDGKRVATLFGVPLPEAAPAQDPAADLARSRASWTPEPQRSSLHAVLVGTAIAGPPRYSLCQLTNTDQNETAVYAVGDTFMGAQIYEILRDRVLIVNDGRNEFIDNSSPAAAAPNLGVAAMPPPPSPGGGEGVKQLSENNYVVAKKEIDGALTNLSELATKARIVPSFKNGVPNGFKLFSIVPDSLYAKIGIQNGDVIRRINGYEMNSPDKALEIYQKLRDANRIEVEVERRGDTVRKSYSIE
jgi:general secretion pathway protein C